MAENEQKQIQHFDDLYPGRFVKAGNLGDKKPTVTIADVWQEDLEGEKGKEQKVVLSFRETQRQLVLPKINAVCLAAMFGKSVPAWIGKRVVLYGTNAIMPMPPKVRGTAPEACIRIFGSPDIAADLAVEFTPPRRKAIHMVMKATGKPGAVAKPAEPEPATAEPEVVDKPMFEDEPA